MIFKPRALVSFIFVFCIITLFSACFEDDGKDYIFKYDINGNPRTLDPQTANDESGLELIANIFDGLVRLDNDGNVQNAVAESYTVSEDGLKYSFKLRDNVFWNDGDKFQEQCTAKDFVFAFQRLFKSSTKSSTAGDFYCIKNSESINRGLNNDLSALGVKALNDFELEITLEYPNPMFLILLTTAPAMPCNEEFYNKTDGKYGLNAATIASNGAFYVYSWFYDKWSKDTNNIIMRRNSYNNSDESIYPYGLNFFIDEADSYANFINGESHTYLTAGDKAVQLLNEGFSYSQSDNTVWGIMFNVDSGRVFSNEYIREAIAYSTDRKNAVLDSTGYAKAESLIPHSIQVGNLEYREYINEESTLIFNTALAEMSIEEALKTTVRSDFTGLDLIVPDDENLLSYLGYIVQQWQSEIGFYCNIKILDTASYEIAIKEKSFDFALVKIRGGYNSPSAYLSCFEKNNGLNFCGYENSSFDAMLKNAERASTEETGAAFYFEAEEMIVGKAIFIPLCFQSEYAFFADECEDINYNPFSKIVTFRSAKHY